MPKSKKEAAADLEKHNQRFYGGMLIMLIAPVVMAAYYYGLRALVLLSVSILTAVLCETLGGSIAKRKKPAVPDLNAVFTGAVIALMLPASAPFYLAVAGSAFAIIAAKLPFGGTNGAPFLPAAAGFAFICVCWPAEAFQYPVIAEPFSTAAAAGQTINAGTSVAAVLQAGGSLRLNIINTFDIVAGNFPGPMGAGSILVLLAASAYMLFTRPSALLNTLGFVASCAAMALLFPRVLTGRLSSVFLELCSGTLLFAALFLLPDTAASPKKPLYRLFYGAFTGILCMLMRHFGAFEEGVCFALLLSNAVWPFIENRLENANRPTAKKRGNPGTPAPADTTVKGGGAHSR